MLGRGNSRAKGWEATQSQSIPVLEVMGGEVTEEEGRGKT